jgi:hypothetical protein
MQRIIWYITFTAAIGFWDKKRKERDGRLQWPHGGLEQVICHIQQSKDVCIASNPRAGTDHF